MENKEFINCLLCNSKIHRQLYIKKYLNQPYCVAICLSCGFIYMNPRFNEKVTKRFYNDSYYYFDARVDRKNIARVPHYIKVLRNYGAKGRLLDLGCAKGFFLKEARKYGWDAYGVDISESACSFAKQYTGIHSIFSGDLKEINFPDQHFDTITLWHILEHLREPSEVLEEIKRILKNKGIMIVEVPNIDSIFYKIYRRYWLGFNPFHLSYFSPQTIKRLLKKAGFKVVRIRTQTVGLFSKEGLWDRGIKTFLSEALDNFKLKDRIKMHIEKRKQANNNIEKDLAPTIDRDAILHENALVAWFNYPLDYFLNKLNMGDNLLVIAQKII